MTTLAPMLAAARIGALARATGLFALAALSALVVWNSLPYLAFAAERPFLIEKGDLAHDTLWRAAFHVHVAGGIVCLVAAFPPLVPGLRRRRPAVHRLAGRIYGASVLLLVVPAGLVLAVNAKGGAWGAAGFLVLGVWFAVTTVVGVRRAIQRRWREHAAWMARSFAMAATAPSFRVVYLALAWADIRNEYVLAIWSSAFLNLVVGEWFVDRILGGETR